MMGKQNQVPVVVNAEEAVRRTIGNGTIVVTSSNCAIPQLLMAALVLAALDNKFTNAKFLQLLSIRWPGGPDYLSSALAGKLDLVTPFAGRYSRRRASQRGAFIPTDLAFAPKAIATSKFRPNVAFVQVSLPVGGRYSLGVEAGIIYPLAKLADVVVAEVNSLVPRTGGIFLTDDDVDFVVHAEYPVPEFAQSEEDDPVGEEIARLIAARIPDRATLQMGIGGIPDRVCKYLIGRMGMEAGIHTEVVSDCALKLMDAGVVTNRFKANHIGISISMAVLGSSATYAKVHNNPGLELYSIDHTNHIPVAAANDRLIAVNGALEVSIHDGEACAHWLNGGPFTGRGGQLGLMMAAACSEGGMGYIALPSTATLRDGRVISRIVPRLSGPVTTPGGIPKCVVTEYGVADLTGLATDEIAMALISIAHPEFRAQLLEDAKRLHLL